LQSGSRGVLPACSKIHPSALLVAFCALLMTFFPASTMAVTPVFTMFPISWEMLKLLIASLPLVRVLLRTSLTVSLSEKKNNWSSYLNATTNQLKSGLTVQRKNANDGNHCSQCNDTKNTNDNCFSRKWKSG
jgi:hypothetical protein